MAKRTKKPKPPREIPLEDSPYKPYERAPHLADIIAQDRALAVLDAAVKSARVHHAWIFQGPQGVGKFSTALALARVLLDPTSKPDLVGLIRPDPSSQTQRLIDAAGHPDLHVIRRTLAVYSRKQQVRTAKQVNIPLEVVREFLLEPAARTRMLSGDSPAHKVLIVDDAHHLAPAAQNAMLKTLEEPPPGTVIILITSRESRLLTTVRSRCQRVAFAPLEQPAMQQVLSAQGIEPDPWLLDMADGSPGELLRMTSLGLASWQEVIEPLLGDLVRGRYPVTFAGDTAALIDTAAKAMVEGDPRASKESANREAVAFLFRIIAKRTRSAMLQAPNQAERWADATQALREGETLISQNVQTLFAMDRLALALHECMHPVPRSPERDNHTEITRWCPGISAQSPDSGSSTG